ncbi:MAG: universal stress protein [Gammaproteobacteria bacterium]|nr:universal stress protein [Gammaproteobacteria bacterium]
MAIARIMVVLDPTLDAQPAFERALGAATITGASLHLYICVNDEFGTGGKEEIVAQYHKVLDTLANRAREKKISVICEVDWHEDWREHIVSAGKRCYADLIIKHSVDTSEADRAKRITADWNLLRKTSCPVLMTKGQALWEDRRILAAVMDKPTDDKHEALNEKVIGFANDFATSVESETHFVAAYKDEGEKPNVKELVVRCQVEANRIHVRQGEIDKVIGETAREIEADLIVIGTAARSGIRATLVGNTSERVLDQTDCDVLVLK